MIHLNLRILTLTVVTAALVSACTQTRVMTLAPAAPDLFDPAALVEVTSSHVVADRHGNVIAGAGEGAGVGMAAGAGGVIYEGVRSLNVLGLALGILLAPVFAVGGGIYGAAAAHPADETKAAIAAIERVYSDHALLGDLAGKIESEILELSFPTLPSCAEPQGNGASALPSPEDCSAAPPNQLRMTVAYAFSTIGAYSPDLQFGIDVEVVAANSDRARDAKAFRWVYLSSELDFFAATSDEATLLRSAIADALQQLAGKIVGDLFLARHEVKLSGTYSPKSEGINFQPAAITPGVAIRVPTQSELINVPEAGLAK